MSNLWGALWVCAIALAWTLLSPPAPHHTWRIGRPIGTGVWTVAGVVRDEDGVLPHARVRLHPLFLDAFKPRTERSTQADASGRFSFDVSAWFLSDELLEELVLHASDPAHPESPTHVLLGGRERRSGGCTWDLDVVLQRGIQVVGHVSVGSAARSADGARVRLFHEQDIGAPWGPYEQRPASATAAGLRAPLR